MVTPSTSPQANSLQEALSIPPRMAKGLERLGIESLEDLLNHFPRRYEDRRHLKPISSLSVGQTTVVSGVIRSVRQRRTRSGKHMVEARVDDGTGVLTVVWFQQRYVLDVVNPGQRVYFYGEVKLRRGLQMVAPEFEVDDESGGTESPSSATNSSGTTTAPAPGPSAQLGSPHLHRIVPVYPTTRGVHQRFLRQLIARACDLLLSDEIRDALWDSVDDAAYEAFVAPRPRLADAYRSIHFPSDPADLDAARQRLEFDEYFRFACRLHRRRSRYRGHAGQRLDVSSELDAKIRSVFPFVLTTDQDEAIREVCHDLGSGAPMYRLLQGDVGTGKTAVALYVSLVAVRNGRQVALMAPTEVLAEQHERTLSTFLEDHPAVRVELLTGSLGAADRRRRLERIASGESHIVVGTQALIQDAVSFHALGLAIVDEQHRFGVTERARLWKKGSSPHLLVMSATPIPRSLCHTAYGDLDLSILKERPGGRPPVKTEIISPRQRPRAMRFIVEELRRGRQAYFVYPRIEESELLEVPAAEEAHRRLADALPGFRVGLLHGRLSAEEKDDCLRGFRDRDSHVLVATVVVEVGIDVPNATVLYIEDASRFGLAQLHQLRGRVGRGVDQGYCFVETGAGGAEARKRLEVLASTTDGFQIAEEDLRLRGPGDFLGARQAGRPSFRIGNPFADPAGFQKVREWAAQFWDDPRHRVIAERYRKRHFGDPSA